MYVLIHMYRYVCTLPIAIPLMIWLHSRRFAQFFLDPLMDSSTAAREVNAVDSEHTMYRARDDWRLPHLLNSLSKPGHPYRRFSGGRSYFVCTYTRAPLTFFATALALHPYPKMMKITRTNLNVCEQWFAGNLKSLHTDPTVRGIDVRNKLHISHDHSKGIIARFKTRIPSFFLVSVLISFCPTV